MHPSITLSRIMQAVEADDNLGICKECGCEQFECEPDARNYKCETCGSLAVFGAAELLLERAL